MRVFARTFMAALTCSVGLMQSLYAQAPWPARPITLVVPFAAGGSTDITARMMAEGLRTQLGQPVVIDNKAGAGGNIGAAFVAKAPPDGYTFLVSTNAHAASPALYKNLTYSLSKDLVPVAQLVSFPNVLVVRADFPAKTLKEFVAYVRASQNPLNYGSAGNGSSHHLATALLNNTLHGRMQHVPYKGGAPAAAALIGGDIQTLIAPLSEVLPFIRGGQLRALALTTREASPLLPGVPSITEELPGYEVTMWSGIMAPAGTPELIVRKLNAAVRTVLNAPDMSRKLAKQGYKPFDLPPEAVAAMYTKEIERWGEMVRISGSQID